MSSLPIGWGDRNNTMSEHDLKLGGDAANKFSGAKNAYSSEEGGSGYKTTEEVKAFYMQQIEQKQEGPTTSTNLPSGWEDRQRLRAVEAKQFGVFSTKPPTTAPTDVTAINPQQSSSVAKAGPTSAEAALVKVATTTLDTMAATLETNPVSLSPDERAAFAAAMQRAMNAIAKCR
ncbi:expressed unknown protein [Seminavis robusta]|uniref:Uncharacterized protein n=1 Tax=Seminavis robusta TaxID=568900 RepID=A0A9N8DFU2_9STRA|nr:expressed unknown protein [Seminavis robusta]|eukprot:Sro98_g050540.1 n/a (175) ;mRNA; r:81909-82433